MLVTRCCNQPGATVLAPLPSFVMYPMAAQFARMKFVGVDLDGRLRARPRRDAGGDRPATSRRWSSSPIPTTPPAMPSRAGIEAIVRAGAGAGGPGRGLRAVRARQLGAAARGVSEPGRACAPCRRSGWPASGWATWPQPRRGPSSSKRCGRRTTSACSTRRRSVRPRARARCSPSRRARSARARELIARLRELRHALVGHGLEAFSIAGEFRPGARRQAADAGLPRARTSPGGCWNPAC